MTTLRQTPLSALDLTPKSVAILTEAGLDSVEAVLGAEDRLPGLPGMTPKRLEAIEEGLRLHRLTIADEQRRSFIGDRTAQAERIEKSLRCLERLRQNGAVDDCLDDAIAALTQAFEYAEIVRTTRSVETVCQWLRDGAAPRPPSVRRP